METPKILLSIFLLSLGANNAAAFGLGTVKNLVLGSTESKVIFYLYTRWNNQPEILLPNDVSSLSKSHFNIRRPTKFLIHGWLDDVNRPFSQILKNNFLQAEDVNVIVVDWGQIAKNPIYALVVPESPAVGKVLGQFMDFLVNQGSNPKSFHLIGHSLGAHIAGFASKKIRNQKPARITGLDIAKPLFELARSIQKLAPSDADFVDCIHTSGGLQGFYEPQCHADFYPNGGINVQPGCPIYDAGICSHQRSFLFFAESILYNHKFPAEKCDWILMPVNCKTSNVNMGYYVDSSVRGVYYLKTADKTPFAPVHP